MNLLFQAVANEYGDEDQEQNNDNGEDDDYDEGEIPLGEAAGLGDNAATESRSGIARCSASIVTAQPEVVLILVYDDRATN